MASQRHQDLPLTVHFGSDFVEVIEFSVEQKTEHQRLERKGKSGYIFGEPCPELNAGDIAGEEAWMYYHSALKQRMQEAERQAPWETQKQARWRASRLKKRLDDPHDESHFGFVSREPVPEPIESSRLPWNVAGGKGGSACKASFACHRLAILWSVPRSAMRMPSLSRQSPSDEPLPADDASAVSERTWCVPRPERLRSKARCMSTPLTSAQRTRIFDLTKRRRSRVHVSFDSIVP
eukprot:TRINITY_DN74601_c0_g1_i1.p1 TRINITY_DN74601_c0_g1~~TRINITY_DN74601_c0_g1_i1.p1  ORF type:complete len:261 (-),score=29.26 TRINITY_DN74601_c0_g1_i1:612-1319(-)